MVKRQHSDRLSDAPTRLVSQLMLANRGVTGWGVKLFTSFTREGRCVYSVPPCQSSRIPICWDFITLTAWLKTFALKPQVINMRSERQNVKAHPMWIVRVMGWWGQHPQCCFMGEIHSNVYLRRMLDFEARCSTLFGIKLPLCLWAQRFPCGASIRARRGAGRGGKVWSQIADCRPVIRWLNAWQQTVPFNPLLFLCVLMYMWQVGEPAKGRLLQMFELLHSCLLVSQMVCKLCECFLWPLPAWLNLGLIYQPIL